MPASFTNQTVRQIVRVSIGGSKVRIRLSNEFGTKPVLIGAASVGLAGEGSDIQAGGPRPLTFGGSKSVVLIPGAPAVSDPVDLSVPPLSDLAVSLFLPAATDLNTVHQVGLQTAFISSAGDFTGKSEFPAVDKVANRFFLAGVMVEPADPAKRDRRVRRFDHRRHALDASTPTTAGRITWRSACRRRRSISACSTRGSAGNRVLSDGAGVSALAAVRSRRPRASRASRT